MINREIYTTALRLIGENPDTSENSDYEDRAPYLLAAFCTESAEIDTAYREANDLPPRTPVNNVSISLTGVFPCASRFTTAASLYLAAMLVIDENIELSDKLFDRYCDAMATIQSEIPAKIEKIAQQYGAL